MRIKIKANKLERTHDIICRCNDVQILHIQQRIRKYNCLLEKGGF